jgi:hypothetical protein
MKQVLIMLSGYKHMNVNYLQGLVTGPLQTVEDSPPSMNLGASDNPFTPFKTFTPARKHKVNCDSICILFL